MRLLAIFIGLCLASASAEIISVRVDWTTIQCNQGCIDLLDKNFRKMKEVADVSIDGASGVATIYWKPGAPFNSERFREAFAKVGIAMNSIHVKVKGKVSHVNKKFYITSLGDNTKFHLLGNVDPSHNRSQATTSPYNRTLNDAQKKTLLQAEKAHSNVTIDGPILEPHQLPPLDLIAEDIQVQGSEK